MQQQKQAEFKELYNYDLENGVPLATKNRWVYCQGEILTDTFDLAVTNGKELQAHPRFTVVSRIEEMLIQGNNKSLSLKPVKRRSQSQSRQN